MSRALGQRITQTQRRMLAEKLRSLLTQEPDLSVKEMVRRTGAPYGMCNFVQKRVREERERAEFDAHVMD